MNQKTSFLYSKHGDTIQFSWHDPNPMIVLISLIGGAWTIDIGKTALHPEHAHNRDCLELSRGGPPFGILPEYARHIWEALANQEGWTTFPQKTT